MSISAAAGGTVAAAGGTVAAEIDTIARHREIWHTRPELRDVYGEWFGWLTDSVRGLTPVVEIGSGPGFLKAHAPSVLATDVLPLPWVDVTCDAVHLPFRSGAVGAILMIDALHHLAHPLTFMAEAARVLRPGGRIAMVEPWVTPASYLLYRYFHHEDCRLRIDLADPFAASDKPALWGNAAIPYRLLRESGGKAWPFRTVRLDRFLALPYLSTLGFKCSRPLPPIVQRLSRACEKWLGLLRPLASTRVLAVLERTHAPADGYSKSPTTL
jgi:SAM-dependent methyltransferase